jgi:hypothetical protein
VQSVYETGIFVTITVCTLYNVHKIKSSLIGDPCKNFGASHLNQRIWHPVLSYTAHIYLKIIGCGGRGVLR